MKLTRRAVLKGTAGTLTLGAAAGTTEAEQPAELEISALVPFLVFAGTTFTVDGEVTAEGGPVEGARVIAAIESRPPDIGRDTTKLDGTFSIDLTAPCQPGDYTVRISATKEEFLPGEETFTIEVSGICPVDS